MRRRVSFAFLLPCMLLPRPVLPEAACHVDAGAEVAALLAEVAALSAALREARAGAAPASSSAAASSPRDDEGRCAEVCVARSGHDQMPGRPSSVYVDHDLDVDLGIGGIPGQDRPRGRRTVSVDDILFGYDILFENRSLFNVQHWKGMVMLQNPSDAFAIQDFLWTEQPDVMIEFGTYYGGSAVFFAEIMAAYNPAAHVITIDPIEWRGAEVEATSSPLWGSMIHPIVGLPSDPAVRIRVERLLEEFGAKRVFISEDSSHNATEVLDNLVSYEHLIGPCGWILVQDTKLSRLEASHGPLEASRAFLRRFPAYRVRRTYEMHGP
mmetsp:Transcript_23009/g.74277  ORF Transcript_23009/g.74277 Transcript_23009/m.74277 type:complete len:324 (-) Transcript_23009:59-1030(-)